VLRRAASAEGGGEAGGSGAHHDDVMVAAGAVHHLACRALPQMTTSGGEGAIMIRSRAQAVNDALRFAFGGHALPDRSDEVLLRGLGANLNSATIRSVLYLGIVAAIVATIVVLVG
jgi:hypothetical protein